MPFQDPQDLQTFSASRQRIVQHWLRRVFYEDWTLKLLALAITFLLWLAVTGQKTPVTKRFSSVQLTFTHADDMEISNQPIEKIDVTLSGSSDELDRLNPLSLVATVPLSDQAPGDRVLRLSRDRVQLNLPEGVRVESFQPGTVSIRLERRIDRQVDVDVKL